MFLQITNQEKIMKNLAIVILSIVMVIGITACDDDGGGTSCPDEYSTCDGVCIDIDTNINHCGSCDNACATGEVCDLGTCSLSCGGGTTACGDGCADTNYDPNHCGSCDNACDTGEVCDMGTCSSSCGGDTVECDGGCVDTQVDRNNCGTCGTACGTTQQCVDGDCVGDDTPPQVVDSTPEDLDVDIAGDLAIITVNFDEVINPSTVATTTITVSNDMGAVSGTTNILSGGQSINFVADSRVGYLQNVVVTVAGTVEDLAGNALGSDHTFSFDTSPSAIVLDPKSFVGVTNDTESFSVLAVGDSGNDVVANATYTIDASDIASVDVNGLVTCLTVGQATLEAVGMGVSITANVFCGEMFGQPTTMQGSTLIVDDYTLMTWDFDERGVIGDGGGDRYDDMWEIQVYNEETDTTSSFPSCDASEISFDTPHVFNPSFIITDRIDNGGTYSCDMGAAGGESLVWQEVTLSATAVSLNLSVDYRLYLNTQALMEVGYTISVEDISGGTGETIVVSATSLDNMETNWQTTNFNMLPWAGETVRIKFHTIGGVYHYSGRGVHLDNVSIIDDQATEYIVNGDFETGDGTGWNGIKYLIPREINYAPTAKVADIGVTRSIYASYDPGSWARYLDTYTNDGTESATIEIAYYGDLGSDGYGVIYQYADGRAFLEYDEDGDPPLGVIPGNTSTVSIPSYSEYWMVTYDLIIAPGESKSILAFHLAGDAIDYGPNPYMMTLSEDITNSVDNLGSGSPYLDGVSITEFNTISNWP
jgi:Bacterial Ig-like domain/Stigma-specific protein, Stig1